MTRTEFEQRWKTFCYDRQKVQGTSVVFPPGVRGIQRTAFGRSGKGRYAPFCFADSYEVMTIKGGTCIRAKVALSPDCQTPFTLQLLNESQQDGHGTDIAGTIERHYLKIEDLRQLIGFEVPGISFLADYRQ